MNVRLLVCPSPLATSPSMQKNKSPLPATTRASNRHGPAGLLFIACTAFGLLGSLNRVLAVTETFESYAGGTVLTTIGGVGVWAIGTNVVVEGGGVAGSRGLSPINPVFNWKAQQFVWSTLAGRHEIDDVPGFPDEHDRQV